MKTPEEIKTCMQRYINAGHGTCLLDDCPLDGDTLPSALAYITRLEEKVAKRDELLAVLGVRIPEDGGAGDDE